MQAAPPSLTTTTTHEVSGASGISDTVVMIDDKTFKDDPFAAYTVQKKHAYNNI